MACRNWPCLIVRGSNWMCQSNPSKGTKPALLSAAPRPACQYYLLSFSLGKEDSWRGVRKGWQWQIEALTFGFPSFSFPVWWHSCPQRSWPYNAIVRGDLFIGERRARKRAAGRQSPSPLILLCSWNRDWVSWMCKFTSSSKRGWRTDLTVYIITVFMHNRCQSEYQ